jgi:hypothetical protein
MPYLLLNLPVLSIVLVYWVHGTMQRARQERKHRCPSDHVLRERVAYMLWVAAGEADVDG